MQEKAVAELDPVLTKTGFTKAVEMMYEDMGTQMAKTLGVEKFGGNVQTSGVKKVGYSYWCTANKDMYRCKVENSLNYVDDAYFDAFSNASLLGKLQNLIKVIDSYATTDGGFTKYSDGTMIAWMILRNITPPDGAEIWFPGLGYHNQFLEGQWAVVATPYPNSDSGSFRWSARRNGVLGYWNTTGVIMSFVARGRWK